MSSSTYHKHVTERRDPSRCSVQPQRDMALKPEIARVFADNFAVCGARKVHRRDP